MQPFPNYDSFNYADKPAVIYELVSYLGETFFKEDKLIIILIILVVKKNCIQRQFEVAKVVKSRQHVRSEL